MTIARMLFVAVTLAAFGSLQGCMATGAGAVAELKSEPGKGLLLIRVSCEGLKYITVCGMPVRRAGTTDLPMSLRGWYPMHEEYWSRFYDESEKGQLIAVSLPAAEYEIFGVQAEASAWGGMRSASVKGFSTRFRVDAGRAVYVGNINAHFYNDTGRLPPHVRLRGWVLPTGSTQLPLDIELRDTRKRDFAELPKRAPGLAESQIDVRLLRLE